MATKKASQSIWARMTTASLATSAFVLCIGAANAFADGGGIPNENASQIAKNIHTQAGELLDVRLGDLHPTQPVLGRMEVYYKLGRYQAGKDSINKRFDDWCEANGQELAAWANADSRLDDPKSFGCRVAVGSETPATIDPMKTAVIGHGGRLYLVDGHHTFTSFMESPDGGPDMHVRVRILGNLNTMGPDAFWTEMDKNGWVWLRDANNQPITTAQLPESLGLVNFANDDFRGLIYFTRDTAYAQNAENANYQEFHWGTWLRNNPDFVIGNYDLTKAGNDTVADSYFSAVKKAAQLMSAQSDATLIDAPFTAGDLGRISFNTSEFNKAKKGYCESKPGKVAYAMYYYHNILGNEPKITCP